MVTSFAWSMTVRAVRGAICGALCLLPLLYDAAVPEVAIDVRVAWILATDLVCLLMLCAAWFAAGPGVNRLPVTRPVLLVLCFAVVAALSWASSMAPDRSWFQLKLLLGCCGLFLLVFYLREARWYERLSWALIIPLSFNGFLILCQALGLDDRHLMQLVPSWSHFAFIDHFRQAMPPAATFSNRNLAASWIVLVLPITLYHLVMWRSRRSVVVAACLLGLALASLILTHSRTSWVAGFAELAMLAVWPGLRSTTKPAGRPLRNGVALLLLLASIGAAGMPLLRHGPQTPATVSLARKAGELGQLVAGNLEPLGPRLQFYVNSLTALWDHPLGGTGIGTFIVAYPRYQAGHAQLPGGVVYPLGIRPEAAHNDFLQTFVEMGLPGGLILIALLASMVPMARQSFANGPADAGSMTPFLLAGIVGFTVEALANFPLQVPTTAALLMVLMAMLTGYRELCRQPVERAPSSWPCLMLRRPMVLALLPSLLAVAGYVAYDVYWHREGQKPLKGAGYLVLTDNFGKTTMDLLIKSEMSYPRDGRLQELRCVAFANTTVGPLSLDDRIAVLTKCLAHDPYNVVTLVNLSNFQYQYAIGATGEVAAKARLALAKLVARLQQIAPTAAQTHLIEGLTELLAAKTVAAEKAFLRALKIRPEFEPATRALASLQQAPPLPPPLDFRVTLRSLGNVVLSGRR